MNRLVPTLYEDLHDVLNDIMPKLEIACNYSLGRYKPEDLINEIKANTMQIWLAFNDNTLDGFVLTQVLDYPQTKTLRIMCLMGVGVEGWQAFMEKIKDWVGFVRQIEDWGKSIGCSLSQIECPPTWEVYMNNYGYRRGHVLLNKELK